MTEVREEQAIMMLKYGFCPVCGQVVAFDIRDQMCRRCIAKAEMKMETQKEETKIEYSRLLAEMRSRENA